MMASNGAAAREAILVLLQHHATSRGNVADDGSALYGLFVS